MGPLCRALYWAALVFAPVLLMIGASMRADADTGVQVYPGMEIHHGSTSCTLGFVEARLRIALTAGSCDGGPTVTDRHGDVVGTVVAAHRDTANGATAGVEYQAISLAPNAIPSDLLPTGRQLQSTPGLLAQPALPVCHFGIATAQTCGRVSSVSNGRFAIQGVAADKRDYGGPVFTLTDDHHAMIVGLFGAEAQSWQAVMQQLSADLHSPTSPSLPIGVRLAGWH